MKKLTLAITLFNLLTMANAASAFGQDVEIMYYIERLTNTAIRFARSDEQKVTVKAAAEQAIQQRDITQREYQEILSLPEPLYFKLGNVARHLAIMAERAGAQLKGTENRITANLLIAKVYIEITLVFPTPPDSYNPGKLWSAPAQAVQFLELAAESLGFFQWGGQPNSAIALFNFHIALGFDELRSMNLPQKALEFAETTYSQRQLYHAFIDHLESAVSLSTSKHILRQHEFYRLILEAAKQSGAHGFRPPIVDWGLIINPQTRKIDENNRWNRAMYGIYAAAERKADKSPLDSKTFRIAEILFKAFTPKWINIGISIFKELGR
jgi:hypothetical protein